MAFISEVRKHLRVHRLLFRNRLLTEMQYRTNFIFGVLMDVAMIFQNIIYAFVAYNVGFSRNGFSADDVLLFSGSFMFVNSLYVSLFLVNLIVTLPNGIRNGTLDLLMTKPISLQFYISTYFIEIPTIVAGILGGIVMIIAAVIRLGLHLNPLTLLGYVFFLFNSVFTMYLFMFLLHLFSFTAVRVGALHEIASSLSDMNRIPVSAYGKVFRNIFIYTIPILLFGNPAPMFLTGRLSVPLGLWSVFVTILLFILSRVLWKAALRRYSSANG